MKPKSLTRAEVFMGFAEHPWLKKSFARLTDQDINLCLDIIGKFSGDDFEPYLNRVFLDRPELRSHNWKIIQELLSCTNTVFMAEHRRKQK